jgi:glutamine amidotransferase
MIAIVDYGVGNVAAFLNMYRRLNIDVSRAATPEDLRRASRVILPGVGSFDRAMARLNASGMREALDTLAREQRVPILGVCVGMQMLGRASDEGRLPGLGWIAGTVRPVASLAPDRPMPVPHMGWNDVSPVGQPKLFEGLDAPARFYFLHAYYFHCDRASDALALTRYGADFPCAVHAGQVFGVQFHPEKSHQSGSRLLRNFAEI